MVVNHRQGALPTQYRCEITESESSHLSGEVGAGDGNHRGVLVAVPHTTGVVVALCVGAGQGLGVRKAHGGAGGVRVRSGIQGICDISESGRQ